MTLLKLRFLGGTALAAALFATAPACIGATLDSDQAGSDGARADE